MLSYQKVKAFLQNGKVGMDILQLLRLERLKNLKIFQRSGEKETDM